MTLSIDRLFSRGSRELDDKKQTGMLAGDVYLQTQQQSLTRLPRLFGQGRNSLALPAQRACGDEDWVIEASENADYTNRISSSIGTVSTLDGVNHLGIAERVVEHPDAEYYWNPKTACSSVTMSAQA